MSALICGSLAYDTIMVFPDHFKNHILPDQIHILNVAFTVPVLRKEFGGCAGNIAYNLKLLGETPSPMGTVGFDFNPYYQWLEKHQISTDYIKQLKDEFTAQAYITTDKDDNQITAFHPGAMGYSHKNSIDKIKPDIKIGIVAPDGKQGMLQHAQKMHELNIPFIFDPGQAMTLFSGDELKHLIKLATYVCVNDYESQLLKEKTQLNDQDICQQVKAYIITRGEQGSIIHTQTQDYEIPAVKPEKLADPTGCGDAYRAGLLYGIINNLDLETTGKIASLMGSIKVAHHGTQNHRFSMAEFQQQFQQAFDYDFGKAA